MKKSKKSPKSTSSPRMGIPTVRIRLQRIDRRVESVLAILGIDNVVLERPSITVEDVKEEVTVPAVDLVEAATLLSSIYRESTWLQNLPDAVLDDCAPTDDQRHGVEDLDPAVVGGVQ